MRTATRFGPLFAIRLILPAVLLLCACAAMGQEAITRDVTVTRGADDPDAISMVDAYEAMVQGHLLGSEQRGINFLANEVRLGRRNATAVYAYVQDGLKEVIALRLYVADAICSERDRIQSKSDLAEQILWGTGQENALRSQVFAGVFDLLDERDGKRFRRYVEKTRDEITVNSRDVERSILESEDSLVVMLGRLCAYSNE
jgi:hypothetical protein